MYCSGCGQALVPGQPVCPQCGRPVAVQVPLVPNLDLQLQTYASRVRALSIVWFIWGALSLALGAIGLVAANAYLNGAFGPWPHGPWGHGMGPHFGPSLIRFAWSFIIIRSALAILAGWGLMERTQWGRVVAIAAGFVHLIKFPIGTALGIWTLVSLLGYRNTTLYDRLSFPAVGPTTPGAGPGVL
jgi:hypothetical protein